MGLFDGIKRAFVLHEIKAWVNDVRDGKKGTGMKKILTALDGYKFILGSIVLLAVKVWDGMHGTHYGDFTGSLLAAFGWDSSGGGFAAEAAGPLIILIGIGHQAWKAQQQVRAGSSVAGALSTEGYVVKHEVDLAAGKPAALAVAVKADVAVEAAKP